MEKKVLRLVIFILMISGIVFADFGGGSGTESDPFQIWTADHLVELSQSPEHWDKDFVQMADIDLGGSGHSPFTPIGSSSKSFSGNYNGNDYKIENMQVVQDYSNGGLFGFVSGKSVYEKAVIEHVCLVNPQVIVSGSNIDNAASLCGVASYVHINDCTVINCDVRLIEEELGCIARGAGGIAGGLLFVSMNRVYCSGTIQVDHFYPTTGYLYRVGGIAGGCNSSEFQDCSFEGSVIGSRSEVGGFIGQCYFSSFDKCRSTGKVTGEDSVGGFVGQIRDQRVSNSFKKCYSQCNVSGETNVGGFSGFTYPKVNLLIQNCYSSGTVSGDSGVGGFSGLCEVDKYPDYIGCFWNAEVNSGLPGISNYSDVDLVGKTTDQMQSESTYTEAGWDFVGESENGDEDIWTIDQSSSYPTFAPFPIPGMGTANDPYLISTPEQLRYFVDHDTLWSSYIKLIEDIDLGYESIGFISRFRGVFDGNGHAILKFGNKDRHWNVLPLFLYVDNGEIKDLTLIDPYIKNDLYSEISTLCGTLESGSKVINCHVVNGYIEGNNEDQQNPGGAASGLMSSSREDCEVADCSYQGTVIAYQASGFIGSNAGLITNSHSNVIVQGGQDASGFIAFNENEISRCYSQGTVKADKFVAGFANTNHGMDLGDTSYQGRISESFSSCTVQASGSKGQAAGFVHLNGSGIVENCYTNGIVEGYFAAGFSIGQMTNGPYSINARSYNCYSSAKLTGRYNARGFVYDLEGSDNLIEGCFWDTQTGGTYSAGGIGRTTEQMQTQSTFTGWDFASRWYMGEYPVLQWELSPLQARIDAAAYGDTIIVQPGVYAGRLYFKGKNIKLTSADPEDPAIVASTVLDGKAMGAVVTFDGSEDETCLLEGFTVTGGKMGGILGNGTNAGISKCVVRGNQKTVSAGGGIHGVNGRIDACEVIDNKAIAGGGLAGCNGIISNCIIANNIADICSGLNNCDGVITNCTITGNALTQETGSVLRHCDDVIVNCIIKGNESDVLENCQAIISYSCMEGGGDNGNIDAKPQFVDPVKGDYHLKVTSMCIDAGDPDSDCYLEPEPDGGRVNMGAYGNTAEAATRGGFVLPGYDLDTGEGPGIVVIDQVRVSRSVVRYECKVVLENNSLLDAKNVVLELIGFPDNMTVVDSSVGFDIIKAGESAMSDDTFSFEVDHSTGVDIQQISWNVFDWDISADINGDGVTDSGDLLIMAGQWLISGDLSGDISKPQDGVVNLCDFEVLAEQWLERF